MNDVNVHNAFHEKQQQKVETFRDMCIKGLTPCQRLYSRGSHTRTASGPRWTSRFGVEKQGQEIPCPRRALTALETAGQ